MSVILDTSFLLAFFNRKDVNNGKANDIMQKLKEGKYGKLFITDYIFDEFVTLSTKRTRIDLAVEWGEFLLESRQIELITTGNEEFKTAWGSFKQLKGISFTDCTLLAVSKHFGIDNIASFDSDFDKIKTIKRICEA